MEENISALITKRIEQVINKLNPSTFATSAYFEKEGYIKTITDKETIIASQREMISNLNDSLDDLKEKYEAKLNELKLQFQETEASFNRRIDNLLSENGSPYHDLEEEKENKWEPPLWYRVFHF